MSITSAQAKTLLGSGTVWTDTELVGRIESFYLDETGDHPTWVAVITEPGEPPAFVPVQGSRAEAGRLVVPATKEQIVSAPRPDAGAALSPEQTQVLLAHYRPDGAGAGSAPSPGDGSMIRSEEQLVVSTVVRPVRRLRVRKRIVTEYVTRTIPLRREELVIEEETLDAGSTNVTPSPDALSARGFDLVLHEERPVVTTEVVAVERVHVAVELVAGDITVTDEVRQEQVVLETAGPAAS